MNKSLALVHLRPDVATPGSTLDLKGEQQTLSVTVERIPFYDPGKTRTHEVD